MALERAFHVLGLSVLAARMAVWVVVVSALARAVSLSRVQRVASFRLSSRTGSQSPEALGHLLDRLLALDWFVFTPSCWKRALVLHRFLALNGIESRILFGVQNTATGPLSGHAWLEHRGRPFLEKDTGPYVVTFSLPPYPSH